MELKVSVKETNMMIYIVCDSTQDNPTPISEAHYSLSVDTLF